MAKEKVKEYKKKVIAWKFTIILIVGIILGVSCFFSPKIDKLIGIGDKQSGFVSSEIIQNSKLSIHYINVGQADCTLICLPDGKKMMIDAAENSSADHVIEYLENLNIAVIDYFILTHSDSDHAGGTKKIFNAFEIKNVYRPFQISIDKDTNEPSEFEDLGGYYGDGGEYNTVNTVTYENFIKAAYTEKYIENGNQKNASVTVFYNDLMISSTSTNEEEEFVFEFFAPLKRSDVPIDGLNDKTLGYPTKYYNDSNDNSPVMLLEYKDESFMFTGDATDEVESDFIDYLSNTEKQRFEKVDVYKLGHHGSNTSNSDKLLSLINPNYVVISSGNEYGHPHQEILDRVANYPHAAGDYLLRTDAIGDIVFGYDTSGALAYTAGDAGSGIVVYWWQIAAGLFIVITIIVISVKVTKNTRATIKRTVSTTKRVTNKLKRR